METEAHRFRATEGSCKKTTTTTTAKKKKKNFQSAALGEIKGEIAGLHP